MNTSLKIILCWLMVIAGAVLVLVAPFNLRGASAAALGSLLVFYGLMPIMRKRKLDRKKSQGERP